VNDIPFNRMKSPVVDLPTQAGDYAVVLNDCWDKIGVTGDGSCIELEKHIHCRNCPVYSNAAAQFLNRSLPADYRRQWTEHFASPKNVSAQHKASVVIFRIGNEWLSLPTHVFQEIAENRPIHSLPHRRLGIALGLVNVRGELLICVSLDRLIGLENIPRAKKSRTTYERFIVTGWNGQRFVFPVCEVHGVHRLRLEDLKEPPALFAQSAGHTQRVFQWNKQTVGLLEAESLFAAFERNLS